MTLRIALLLLAIASSTACDAPDVRARRQLDDSHPAMRAAAAKTLGDTKDRASVPKLIALTDDTDPGVAAAAIRALGAIGDLSALPAILRHGYVEPARSAAFEAVVAVGPPAVPTLQATWMRAVATGDGIERFVVEALRRQPDADAFFVAKLRDGDPRVRRGAVSALGVMKDRAAVPSLLSALDDDDPAVVNAAGNALVSIQDAAALPRLMALIGQPGMGTTIAKTGPASSSVIYDRRWAAADAAGAIGATAIPPLVAASANRDSGVRARAASALGAIHTDAAAVALVRLLDDPDADVREHAQQALRSSGAAAIAPLVERITLVRGARLVDTLWIFEGLTPDARAVEPLLALLVGADASMSRKAGRALVAYTDPRIDRAMDDALARRDMGVIAAMPEAFVRLGRTGSEGTLIEAMNRADDGMHVAQVFVNSHNGQLEKAGRDWADRHHAALAFTPSRSTWAWGRR